MAIDVRLPKIAAEFVSGTVCAVHIDPFTPLQCGAAIMDIKVDFSAGQAYDCPPVAYYRIMLGEVGQISRLDIAEGQELRANAVIGAFEPAIGADDDQRSARVTVASILHHDDWW